MTGYHTVRGGRYKCDYCTHNSYKTVSGIITHLKAQHADEMAAALEKQVDDLKTALRRAENKPPRVEVREKVVYKNKPEPKYWYTKSVGIAGIYCSTCKQVTLNPGIPTGQTIENTPHHCGNRTLLPVVEVR